MSEQPMCCDGCGDRTTEVAVVALQDVPTKRTVVEVRCVFCEPFVPYRILSAPALHPRRVFRSPFDDPVSSLDGEQQKP